MVLKTLKEIQEEYNLDKEDLKHSQDEVSVYRLRQEAIKWVKEIRFRLDYQDQCGRSRNACLYSDEWILHFFNITEKELPYKVWRRYNMVNVENKLSDDMYSFNASISLFLGLKTGEEDFALKRKDLIELNKKISDWIKKARQLEAQLCNADIVTKK